ncbi:DUF4102 domain-containing protein [Sphingobium yanoikuyae]|uniref:DUF4102 domain-containing protein n=1 Tax=Sphingobium yanoikuyae TaxID=13690 RepID=A0A430BUX6_SPHYA|nr:DUF4102 domain-containing protein [Sphingobium yanoikuyae]
MALTVAEVKDARPGERDYSLLIPPACTCSSPRKGRSPGVSNRFSGKGKRLTFGLFPDVTLADARDQRDAARAIVRAGKNPDDRAKAVRLVEDRLSSLAAATGNAPDVRDRELEHDRKAARGRLCADLPMMRMHNRPHHAEAKAVAAL